MPEHLPVLSGCDLRRVADEHCPHPIYPSALRIAAQHPFLWRVACVFSSYPTRRGKPHQDSRPFVALPPHTSAREVDVGLHFLLLGLGYKGISSRFLAPFASLLVVRGVCLAMLTTGEIKWDSVFHMVQGYLGSRGGSGKGMGSVLSQMMNMSEIRKRWQLGTIFFRL